MKLKLIEPGFEGYTGPLGAVDFENGISTREVNHIEASMIANAIRAETLEGFNPSSSQMSIDAKTISMDSEMVRDVVTGATTVSVVKVWELHELEAVADAEGINGLRKIGDTVGVKANGIAKLITLILEAQCVKTKQADVPVEEIPTK